MLCSRALRRTGFGLGVLGLAFCAWGVWYFFQHPLDGAQAGIGFAPAAPKLPRTAPDGTTYSVGAGPAVYGLEMAPEDDHTQKVFPSYAAALRYARAQGLSTMPSTPLVLATARALDTRLQIAVEIQCEQGEAGRPALLVRWLAAVVALRARSSVDLIPACDAAAAYLGTAIHLGGGEPLLPAGMRLDPPASSTALGPWGEHPVMERIWRRDQFLARGLDLGEHATCSAAAVLARTLAEDPVLTAGWARQATVSAAWAGAPVRPTIESLVPVLAAVPIAELTAPATLTVIRAACSGSRTISPAAMAMAGSPEEDILIPLGMGVWDDPIGALVSAIEEGRVDLTPGPQAGFYRRRWHALETLAAPHRAPEALKLQLTADYQRRWHRAFAAGFTEGRSGMLKRLPEIYMGLHDVPPLRVEVAPQFTAEPTPSSYVRLSRAYRLLASELEAALGTVDWRGLHDAAGGSLADGLAARADLYVGLAAQVSDELGYPLPKDAVAADTDVASLKAAAVRWAATAEEDPDVGADARCLVPLQADGNGHRCPAIVGVRLEAVVCRWVEEPAVMGKVAPSFVPARWWLPSPCPLVTTVATIPTAADFRARCDTIQEVAGLYASFGQAAPVLRQAPPARWPWILAGGGICVLLVLVVVIWFRLSWRGRLISAASVVLITAVIIGWLVMAPPYGLVRWVVREVVPMHANSAQVLREALYGWGREHANRLLIDLITDQDPQIRYLASWWHLAAEPKRLTSSELRILKAACTDAIPEVAYTAWRYRCRSGESTADLIAELEATTATVRSGATGARLELLTCTQRSETEVSACALRLADTSNDEQRSEVINALTRWYGAPPAIQVRLLEGLRDPVVKIRKVVLEHLAQEGAGEDLPRILALVQDPDSSVRLRTMHTIAQVASRARIPWSDAAIQSSMAAYADNPSVTPDERITAGLHLTDQSALSHRLAVLLELADALPETDGKPFYSHNIPSIKRWPRIEAQAQLVLRWLGSGAPQAQVGYVELGSDLVKQKMLLESLLALMRIGSDVVPTLPVLQAALVQPGSVDTVLALIRRLGPTAAPLVEQVITVYQQDTTPMIGRQAMQALAAMGPIVADRSLPVIDAWLAQLPTNEQRKLFAYLREVAQGKPVPTPGMPMPPGLVPSAR